MFSTGFQIEKQNNSEAKINVVDEEELRLQRRAHKKKLNAARERAKVITEVYGEQTFVPGVDAGLKIWIFVREQLRAVNAGELKLPETYPSRIKYDYRGYWMEETHKEWPMMIQEALAEKEIQMQAKEKRLYDERCAAEAAAALAELYAKETPIEKQLRLDEEQKTSERLVLELALMHAADIESQKAAKAYAIWLQEEMEIMRSREKNRARTTTAEGRSRITTAEGRARTATAEGLSRASTADGQSRVATADSPTRESPTSLTVAAPDVAVRYNKDGTIKQDRGVYGVLPLLDASLPRRNPGMTLTQFQNFLNYSGDKRAALLLAFNHQHWKYFEMVLESAGSMAKVLINTPIDDHNCRTLLHSAVLRGDPERVTYLLDRGADPLIGDRCGDTPLHLSMDHDVFLQYHDVSIAADLLRSRHKSANKAAALSEKLANAANHRGVTPLHRSIILGALKYVELILKKKAKVFVFDNCGKLPIQYVKDDWEHEVKVLFNDNVRFCGKRMHQQMWAYIMSRKFVVSIFDIVSPKCNVCKRKQYVCSELKARNFRYWLYSHDIAKGYTKKK